MAYLSALKESRMKGRYFKIKPDLSKEGLSQAQDYLSMKGYPRLNFHDIFEENHTFFVPMDSVYDNGYIFRRRIGQEKIEKNLKVIHFLLKEGILEEISFEEFSGTRDHEIRFKHRLINSIKNTIRAFNDKIPILRSKKIS